ncbi:hypothetical protein M1N00_03745 [Thermodesulfovibrionales bacterium]|nr:hypothetical protein [Thermodesulfovibrionales bacterium]
MGYCDDKQRHDSQVGILERTTDLQEVARDRPQGPAGARTCFCPGISPPADGLAA